MLILVINCGSSSLKFQLINTDNEKVLAAGICDRIGLNESVLKYKNDRGIDEKFNKEMNDHAQAIGYVLDALIDQKIGVLGSLDEIHATGHRFVHGGEYFKASALITDDVIERIVECSPLAPLHNPANLIGADACRKLMPSKPMVAVFDTAFHQSMPSKAYIYGLPYDWYEKHKVRRYGFHGTSHKYVSQRAVEMLKLDPHNHKIIVCHLGNGSSVCAIENGKSMDTSMGLTPLEGLIMGTRSGDVDPGVLEYIAEKEGYTTKELVAILNKKSGVLGISKLSNDFRDLLEAALAGNELAELARQAFCYRVLKYIGAYCAALNGVDAICFCGGVGENAKFIREVIVENLQFLGVTLDKEANNTCGQEVIISTNDSRVKVCVVPTNEEIIIARDTKEIVSRLG